MVLQVESYHSSSKMNASTVVIDSGGGGEGGTMSESGRAGDYLQEYYNREQDRDSMVNRGSDNEGGSDDDRSGDRRQENLVRNKEHARRTRLRKKEQLDALKDRVIKLEEEGKRLKQDIQECSVASILLGLSSGTESGGDEGKKEDSILSSPSSNFGQVLAGGKRKRFLSLDGEDEGPPPMELNIKGQIFLVGGSYNDNKSSILNWKTGVYLDKEGKWQQLTKSELEELRRERNRMHAKMTRDRKKAFIASLKRVIAKLEDENKQLRETLERARADEMSQKAAKKAKRSGDVYLSSKSYQSNTASSMFSSNIYAVG